MSVYMPNKSEEFMNDNQRRFFKEKLISWRHSLISERDKQRIDREPLPSADALDNAAIDLDLSNKLASKERINMLLGRIDQALKKLDDGSYGYCEETGEPIDVDRLMARPIATLSVEAQERLEKMKKREKMMVF